MSLIKIQHGFANEDNILQKSICAIYYFQSINNWIQCRLAIILSLPLHHDVHYYLYQESRAAGLNLDIQAIMSTWTLQKNYPLVTVRRDYGQRRIRLYQVCTT